MTERLERHCSCVAADVWAKAANAAAGRVHGHGAAPAFFGSARRKACLRHTNICIQL